MSKTSIRTSILNASDIQSEVVDVPEWSVKLELRGMNGLQRSVFLRKQSDGKGGSAQLFADLIIATAFDPDSGDRIFEDADRDVLNEKSGAIIQRLGMQSMALSGIGGGSVEEAKDDLKDSPSDAST